MADLDDLFGDEGDEAGEDGAPAGKSDPSTPPGSPKSTDKRITDLQSKADQETARANKLQKELERLKAAQGGAPEAGKAPVTLTGAEAQATTVLLDMVRSFAMQQNPKLAEYGVDASDLTGTTPAEIAASAAALGARLEKLETRARNKVLAEQGLTPEIDGAPPAKGEDRDFSKMSTEDFKKLVDGVLGGAPVR